MPEIRLVNRYPHIKDEDVTNIFQEGYIKGFENGRKGAIPIEYIYRRATEFSKMYSDKDLFTAKEIGLALVLIVRDWEVENDKNI